MKLNSSKFFVFTFAFMQMMRFFPYYICVQYYGLEEAGLWSLLLVIINFSKLAQLGVISAMNRDLPIFYGSGRIDSANLTATIAFYWNILSLLILTLIGGVFSIFIKDQALQEICYLSMLVIPMAGMHQYYEMRLKGKNQFFVLAQSQIIFGVILMAFSCASILISSLKLLVMFYAAAYMLTSIYLHNKCDPLIKLKFKEAIIELRRLVKIGIPLFAASLGSLALLGIDKFFVAGSFTKEDLGNYSISIFATNGILMVTFAVSQITYSKMGYDYGRNKNAIKALLIGIRPMWYLMLFNAAALVFIEIFGNYFVGLFFPKLINAIGILKIFVFSSVIYSTLPAFTNMLIILNRQYLVLATQLLSILLNLGMIVASIKLNWGIAGIAWASFFGILLQSLMINLCGYRYIFCQKKRIQSK